LPSRMLAPGSFLDVLEEARAEAGQRIEPVSTGSGFPCTVMTAALTGGTLIFGGKATIVGTYCGAYIIGMIEAGLVATGMQGFWVRAVVGLVFLAAVIFHLTMEDPARLRRLRHFLLAKRFERRPAQQTPGRDQKL
jgi:simple sugar transport system permease protein